MNISGLLTLFDQLPPYQELRRKLREDADVAPLGLPRSVWPALLVRWELALLSELGFGLDLEECAATGTNDALIYVSPKSGRAVSASAGEPYRDRLLPLPAFLLKGRRSGTGVSETDVVNGLKLSRYFLEQRVLAPREIGMPEPRIRLETLLQRR